MLKGPGKKVVTRTPLETAQQKETKNGRDGGTGRLVVSLLSTHAIPSEKQNTYIPKKRKKEKRVGGERGKKAIWTTGRSGGRKEKNEVQPAHSQARMDGKDEEKSQRNDVVVVGEARNEEEHNSIRTTVHTSCMGTHTHAHKHVYIYIWLCRSTDNDRKKVIWYRGECMGDERISVKDYKRL